MAFLGIAIAATRTGSILMGLAIWAYTLYLAFTLTVSTLAKVLAFIPGIGALYLLYEQWSASGVGLYGLFYMIVIANALLVLKRTLENARQKTAA